jgi:hypothetical protein
MSIFKDRCKQIPQLFKANSSPGGLFWGTGEGPRESHATFACQLGQSEVLVRMIHFRRGIRSGNLHSFHLLSRDATVSGWGEPVINFTGYLFRGDAGLADSRECLGHLSRGVVSRTLSAGTSCARSCAERTLLKRDRGIGGPPLSIQRARDKIDAKPRSVLLFFLQSPTESNPR